VAGGAAAAIGTETLEKRPGEIELSGFVESFQNSMRVGKWKEIREKRRRTGLGPHDSCGTQQERAQYTRTNFQHGWPPVKVARTVVDTLANFYLAVNLCQIRIAKQ
jgi:hypothetical protein